MAYTYEQISQAWTAVHDGVTPDAATTANFQVVAALSANGQMTDAQILSGIVNSADNSTALAILSYQFFTGKSPTKVGVDYLVNSSVNKADLNDSYYAKFNIENRYINFAANLGVIGEGAAAFAGKYGALSFADYVASIYQTIIGGAYATAAGVNVAAAIADIISRKDAIQATAQSAGMIKPNATAAEIDIALKAATAGYLMGEAIKSDVGIYAAAANNFMVAMAQGSATYNTDITKTYEPTVDSFSHGTGKAIDRGPTVITPPPTPTTPTTPTPNNLAFALLAGADTFDGAGGDDTFTATSATFDATDTLTGGPGNDTLTINATGAFTAPNAAVSGIETVTIIGDNSVVATNAANWTGVTQLNVTSTGAATVAAATGSNATVTANTQGAGNVVVNGGVGVTVNANNGTSGTVAVGGATAPTGAIVVNLKSTADATTLGATTVTGGSTVTVNAVADNPTNAGTQTTGAITVNGKATTTAVTINAPTPAAAGVGVRGVAANTVTVNDLVNGGASTTKSSITSISIDGATTVNIADNALSNLSIAHTSGNVIIDNSSNLSGGNKTTTLGLTLNGATGGTLDDADVYTTVNATTGAQASTLANFTFGALTALNLAGASQLTLNAATGLTALATVTVTGAAGIVANLSAGTVTSVNTAATTGASTVTINGANATFTGGAGVDTVTLTNNAVTKAIALGGGNDFVDITSGATVSTGAIDGGGGTADILRMTAAQAATASGSSAFATKVTNLERLQLTGATNQTIDLGILGNYHHVSTSGGNGLTLNGLVSTDTFVLTGAGTAYTLGSGNFGGGSDSINLQLTDGSASGVSFASTGITATGVETANITVTDAQAIPAGAFNDAVTWRNSDIKTINVSGNAGLSLTADSTALTSVDASGITLGGFSFTSGALTAAAAIKGSTTGTNTVTFSLATGGAVTYTGGAGNDNVTGSNGLNNIVSLGNGANSYTATTGNHQVTGGTGVDTISVGGGASTINVGSGADGVIFSAATASSVSFTAITGMSVGTSDTITFNGQAPTAGALGAAVVAGGSLAASLDAAAASATGAGTPVVKWFVFGGDTYVVLDHSDNATFTAGVDYAVKLVGALNLATSSVAGAVLTL